MPLRGNTRLHLACAIGQRSLGTAPAGLIVFSPALSPGTLASLPVRRPGHGSHFNVSDLSRWGSMTCLVSTARCSIGSDPCVCCRPGFRLFRAVPVHLASCAIDVLTPVGSFSTACPGAQGSGVVPLLWLLCLSRWWLWVSIEILDILWC